MFRGPARHLANEVMRDLTVSILVGFAAVIACGLLTRMWICSETDNSGGVRDPSVSCKPWPC